MVTGHSDERSKPFSRDRSPSSEDRFEARVRKWQETRIQRKQELEYRSALTRLNELVEGNRNLPVHLTSVHVTGAPSIRTGFLASVINPYLSSLARDEVTLEEIIKNTAQLSRAFEKTDAFSSVLPTLRRSESIYASPRDVELHLQLKQRPRFFAKTSTELGNNEGSASITSTVRSLFGGAETLSANLAFGTRTRRAFHVSLSAPLVNIDATANTWGDVSAFSRENDWTSSSSFFLREDGINVRLMSTRKNSKHEIGYEAALRCIGNLSPRVSIGVREAAGSSCKSAIHHTWTYDSRNDPFGIDASRGFYIKSSQELAGTLLGGDASHFKTMAECQISRRITQGLTLSLGSKTGFIYPLGSRPQSLLPDRLFLGGSGSVRMFRERGMGPHDKSDALGGELMWAAGASLIGDIPKKPHWPVKWHTFINAGRLDNYIRDKDFVPQFEATIRQPSITAGLGLVYKFEPVRVEMNFGVPLVQSRGEKSRKGIQVGVGVEFL